MSETRIQAIVEKHGSARGGLITILDEIQTREGYLSESALRSVARLTGRCLTDVYGVATFYKAFRLTPRGKHLASVCMGTACHVRGSPSVVREFEERLQIDGDLSDGGTSPDGKFTLQPVRCVGACAQGPIVVIDGEYYANVGPGRVPSLIQRVSADRQQAVLEDERNFPIEVSCPRCNHSLMDSERLVDGLPSIRLTVSYGEEHGWLRLSSLYGSYSMESGGEIPADTLVDFFCPHCHGDLMGAWNCSSCAAPMVPMLVQGGGLVHVCSRRGCHSHMLDLGSDVDADSVLD